MSLRTFMQSRTLLLLDLVMIAAASLGSLALRTDMGQMFRFYFKSAGMLMLVSMAIVPIVYHWFGMYHRMWVYASISELKLLFAAVTTSSVLIALVMVLLRTTQVLPYMPRSLVPIQWLLLMLLTGGSRFLMRMLAETQVNRTDKTVARRVLIVGAGDAGALVVREMQKNLQLRLKPICFLDDNLDKQRRQIHGVPVVGTIHDLSRAVITRRIQEVIIAIPSAPGRVVRQVTEVCRARGIPFRTMPGIYELLGGKVNVSRLREVTVTDLLRREPANIDDSAVGVSLSGKRVLVTGAGGSIGCELCRQISRWQPASLMLLGHGENSIFETLLEIGDNFPSLAVVPIIADIRDYERLNQVFEQQRPQVVFHTAAHKHVPLMEVNIEDAVSNNVLGTRNVVDISLEHGVERMVMISTDKAIRPSSVYGATKRIAELLVLDAAHRSGMPYTVVRFGNVLGSRGSVIPKFKSQIARGGPVTITHPDMKRYFMTIPEAVHLVLQASAMGEGGEVFVLNMGEQIRILDLAEDLVRLSGLEPGRDIEFVFTGIRPGEKLSEELWDRWTTYEPTRHPDIVLLAGEDLMSGEALRQAVEEMIHLARQGETNNIIQIFDDCIPFATVRCEPPPEITSLI